MNTSSNLPVILHHNELEIEICKNIYKKHFIGLTNRRESLKGLELLHKRLQVVKPSFIPLKINERYHRVQEEIKGFLTNTFGNKIAAMYINTPKYQRQANRSDKQGNFFYELLNIIHEASRETQEATKKEWEHQLFTLKFLYDCIFNYGLHPDINNRIPEQHKRFNLVIEHNKAGVLEYACLSLISQDVLEQKFLQYYRYRKPILIRGILLSFDQIYSVKITTTLLKDDEILLWGKKYGFAWKEDNKDELRFSNCCKDETENYLPHPFDNKETSLHTSDLSGTLRLLKKYPKADKVFRLALTYYESGVNTRETLDNCRLSLELLLKDIFENEKSLENQIQDIGKDQKAAGASKELINMLQTLLNYYTKYQNAYVKHSDNVKANEVGFIIDQTSSFISFLLK